MAWKPNREPNKEPNKKKLEVELAYSNEFEDATTVLSAEQIVSSAFRSWIEKAGIGERRANTLVHAAEDDPRASLSIRERELIVRRADTAIKRTYGSLGELGE